MARKILLDGGGGGASGGAILLLLLVPIAIVMFGSRNRRGRGLDTSSRRSRGGEGRDAEPRPNGKEKKKEEEEKKKKKKGKKQDVQSSVKHREPVDESEYKKYRDKNPNNPFFQHHVAPEGYNPNSIQARPVNRPAVPEQKGAHHPYDKGRILPREQKRKSVSFVGGPDGSDEDVVRQLARLDPWTTQPKNVDLSFYEHRNRDKEHHKSKTSGVKGPGPMTVGEQFGHHSFIQKRQLFIELTNSLKEPPVSMAAEDIKILLTAVEIVCAEMGSAERQKAMQDSWNTVHGPYPMIADAPIKVLNRYFEKRAIINFCRFMEQSQAKQIFAGLLSRMKLRSSQQVTPLNLLWGWFFDHFRLVSIMRKVEYRMVADDRHSKGPQHGLHTVAELKVGFNLLVWLEIFCRACAQIRLMSPRGLDLASLNSRAACVPVERTPGGYMWALIGSLFMPGGAGSEAQIVKDWVSRIKGVEGEWCSANAMWINEVGRWAQTPGTDVIKYRRLVIRPGWTVDAVFQVGDGSNTYDPGHNRRLPGQSDDVPVLFESEKGVECNPTAHAIYAAFRRAFNYVEPKVVTFNRRGQYSWSGNSQSYRADGFRLGEIVACLGALGQYLQQSGSDVLAKELPNRNNAQEFIKMLDFGTCVPLEYEAKDNAKVYTFPSLHYFPGLQHVFIPYISVEGNFADAVPSKQPMSSAVIALTPSMGLWQQLGERKAGEKFDARKVALVVTLRPPRTGQVDPEWADKWSKRLLVEVQRVAAHHNTAEAQWRDRIKWIEMKWNQSGEEVPVDLLGPPRELPSA